MLIWHPPSPLQAVPTNLSAKMSLTQMTLLEPPAQGLGHEMQSINSAGKKKKKKRRLPGRKAMTKLVTVVLKADIITFPKKGLYSQS